MTDARSSPVIASAVRWQRVNEEPFEYAIQQGPHGDEFVKLLNGECLRRIFDVAQEVPERLPTHGSLLADINNAAHAAGTNAWVRDVLKRAHRAIRLSAPLSSTDREGGK